MGGSTKGDFVIGECHMQDFHNGLVKIIPNPPNHPGITIKRHDKCVS